MSLTLAALAERVDLLEEELRRMRAAIMANAKSWRGLKLTPGEWVILDALSSGKVCRYEAIQELTETMRNGMRTCSQASVRIRLNRLRAKMAALNPPIRIDTIHGFGYQILGESLERLAAIEIMRRE